MVKRALVYDNVSNVTTISTNPIVGTGGNINAKGVSPFITSNGAGNGIVWGLDGTSMPTTPPRCSGSAPHLIATLPLPMAVAAARPRSSAP